MLLTTMESEVEIEVEFEVGSSGREDEVNVEVGVKSKLNLSFVLCNLLLARDSAHIYFWWGKLISLAKSRHSLPKVLQFTFGGEYRLLARDVNFWRGILNFWQGICLLLAGDMTFSGGR